MRRIQYLQPQEASLYNLFSITRNQTQIFSKFTPQHPPIAPNLQSLPFMGKPLASTIKFEAYARLASERFKPKKLSKPQPKTLASLNQIDRINQTSTPKLAVAMEDGRREALVPLSEVVSDCVKRWFQDTLKEARNGDQSMQVLVGQMYQSGYGVAKNEQKARAWIGKASRYRPSAWKVSDKHPGYNASDSDSDEVKDDTN